MQQPQRKLRTPSSAHHAITPRLTSSKRLSCFNLVFTLFTQSANSHHHSGTIITHAKPSATSSGSTVGFKLPTAPPSKKKPHTTSRNLTQQPSHSICSNHLCNPHPQLLSHHHNTAQQHFCITTCIFASPAQAPQHEHITPRVFAMASNPRRSRTIASAAHIIFTSRMISILTSNSNSQRELKEHTCTRNQRCIVMTN